MCVELRLQVLVGIKILHFITSSLLTNINKYSRTLAKNMHYNSIILVFNHRRRTRFIHISLILWTNFFQIMIIWNVFLVFIRKLLYDEIKRQSHSYKMEHGQQQFKLLVILH